MAHFGHPTKKGHFYIILPAFGSAYTSVSNPDLDPDPWIQGFLAGSGSGSIFGSGSTDPGNLMFFIAFLMKFEDI